MLKHHRHRFWGLSLILLLALAVVTTACGGGASSNSNSPSETTVPQEQSGSPDGSTPEGSGGEQGETPLATADNPYKIDIYTTKFGTAGYVLAQGIADIVNKNNPKLKVSVVETTGMVDAHNIIQDPAKQKNGMAAYATPYHSAIVNGEPPMKQPGEFEFIAAVFDGGFTIATLDPNIKEPQDLIGKRVSTGSPSAFGPTVPALFEVWGIRDKLAQEARMAQPEGQAALLDGLLDAAVFSSARTGEVISGSPALEEVLARKGAHLINISKEDAEKVAEKYPEAVWMEAPPGSFGFDQPTGMIASINGFSVHPNFPEEIAYEFTKTLLEHNDALQEYHAYGKNILDKSFLLSFPESLGEYHEGAVKAYKEAGILQ